MSAHTPGPWTIESDGTTVSMGGQCVIVGPAPDSAPIVEQRANAALIAAAPSLLAACKAALSLVESLPYDPTDRQTLRINDQIADAIARAYASADSYGRNRDLDDGTVDTSGKCAICGTDCVPVDWDYRCADCMRQGEETCDEWELRVAARRSS